MKQDFTHIQIQRDFEQYVNYMNNCKRFCLEVLQYMSATNVPLYLQQYVISAYSDLEKQFKQKDIIN